ncbi:hypothetical protein OAM07_03600 [Crocinitomicaceae bacterium]|jgi:hypothetical protein|nr:hypothetical protein [Crocinitomicaceae bacterium]
MKKVFYLVLVTISIVSCTTPTVEISRPEWVPSSMRWGVYEHNACNDGRMHFNEDSSVILIVPERAKYNETSTSLIGANVIINGE